MPRLNVHEQTMRSYVFYMILRDLFTPATDLEELCCQHDIDIRAIHVFRPPRIWFLNGFVVSHGDKEVKKNVTRGWCVDASREIFR
jgi:hypothetical protein